MCTTSTKHFLSISLGASRPAGVPLAIAKCASLTVPLYYRTKILLLCRISPIGLQSSHKFFCWKQNLLSWKLYIV